MYVRITSSGRFYYKQGGEGKDEHYHVSDYQVQLVYAGTATNWFDGKPYALEAGGDIVFCKQGRRHASKLPARKGG